MCCTEQSEIEMAVMIISRPKKYPISLSDDDILMLQTVIGNKDCSKTVQNRCRILLDLDLNKDKNFTHAQCAKANGVSTATVTNIVRLYYFGGIEKVITLNRNENSNNGRHRQTSTDKGKDSKIACGYIGALCWTLHFANNFRKAELEIPMTGSKICWHIPAGKNAEFVADMEEILEIYSMPYNLQRPVVCMSERRFKFSKDICGMYVFIEPLSGKRHVSIRTHMTGYDWAEEIRYMVSVMYEEAEKVILVMDKANTHIRTSLYQNFSPEEARRIRKRLDMHYTPKYGSWLNLAAIELNVMHAQCVFRQIDSGEELNRQLSEWESEQAVIQWKYTLTDARNGMVSVYPGKTQIE